MLYKKEFLVNSRLKKKFLSILIVAVMLLASFSIIFVGTVAAAPNDNVLEVIPGTQNVTVGGTFYTLINISVNWEIDNVTISNITFLPAGVLNYSFTMIGNLFSGGTWTTPENTSDIYNASGYAFNITWINGVSVNLTNSTVANITWLAYGVGAANVNITGTTANNNGANYTTTVQNATVIVHPEGPSSFTAETYNDTQINLTFSHGIGADKIAIVYKTGSPPSNMSDGTPLCNTTSDHFEHTGLNPGTHIYYRAIAWNATANFYSLETLLEHNTTESSEMTMVRGNVTDGDGSPLSDVYLEMFKQGPGDWFENSSQYTNSTGEYSFNLSVENAGAGMYDLNAFLDGYVSYGNWSVFVSDGQTVWIDIELPQLFVNCSYIYGRINSSDSGEILNNSEIVVLDTDFTHMMEGMGKGDMEYTNNMTYNNESGYFMIPINYKSIYNVLAFKDGYYAAFSNPSINVGSEGTIYWNNFSLNPAQPDNLSMVVEFSDLDDVKVTVNRSIVAESPLIRFALDFMPGVGNNNQNVSQTEVAGYLQMMGSYGPTVNVSLDEGSSGGGGEEGPPDFLQIYVSLKLDGSNLDLYKSGTYNANLDNVVNTSVSSTETIYYNATFNLTLDGPILNQTNHTFNVSSEYKNLINTNINVTFGNFYNVSQVLTNQTNNSVITTTSTVIVNPGNGSADELAYTVLRLILNASTVSLPIFEEPTWHTTDEWELNQTDNNGTSTIKYIVDGKPLKQWDRFQYTIGDLSTSYLCYYIGEETSTTYETKYITLNDIDWIVLNDQMEIDYLINDLEFPLYNSKTWSTRSWWGENVTATVIDCSEAKTTQKGTFSCVKVNYTNASSSVVGQEWYSPDINFLVNRTRYDDAGVVSILDLKEYSLAPYIQAVTIYANDSDSNSLYNSIDVNLTINASGLSSPADFILEGPFYKESSGFGPPTDITWTDKEINDISGIQTVTVSFSGSLINAKQVNGPYSGWLELREQSDWGPGRSLDYAEFQTAQYNYTDFELPVVSFSNITDYGNDTNVNGQYDYLTINVTVNVTQTGNYSLHGGLHKVVSHGFWDEWYWITGTGTEVFNLVQGTTPTLVLNFKGSEIYEKGYDGQFKFHIEIYDNDNYVRVSEKENSTSRTYYYTDFETPSVYFNKSWMNQSGLHDYINSSTYLTINASIAVGEGTFGGETRTYDIHGGLHFTENIGGDFGDFITGAGQEIELSEGENIIPLNFNIGDISAENSSYNGTFVVGIGFSERIGGWIGPDIDNYHYYSASYNVSSDFPDPPISMTVMNDSVISNGDYLRILVNVTTTSDEYANHTYDIHGGIHYVENNDWFFIAGMGQQITLNYGTNLINLDFSGMEIAASGKNGPYSYWIGLDRLPNYEMIANKEGQTSSYTTANFTSPSIQFGNSQNFTDFTNGTDYLTVQVQVIVNQNGIYHIGGGIHWIEYQNGWDDWRFITGTGNEYTLSQGTYNLSINFDQGMIRDALQVNNYAGILKVHIGIENASTWQHIANAEYDTSPYSYSNFSASAVSVVSATEQIDVNGDLIVNLTLNVSTSDTYTIHGGIHWIETSNGWDNWWFITGTWDQYILGSGETNQLLTFNGGEIFNSLQDGPYKIWIGVENTTTYQLVASTELETSSYNYTDFAAAAPGVRIVRENMTDGTVDYMNGSYLTVNVSLHETSNGTYWLDGGLHNSNWNWITGTGDQITLVEGENIVPLNLNAGDIYSSGYDGPYKVWIGLRNTTTWSDVDHYEYTTQSYTSSQAPPPPIQFESMSDGQCDYLNSSYITINVTLNVSSDSYADTYDLHGGINYVDSNGWWQFLTGAGNWVYLSNGTNNMSLNFNAGEIRSGLPDGYNDNLEVWMGLSDINTWNEIGHKEYTTQQYNKNDLPGPQMTMSVTGDHINESANGSYFTVNLTINVSSGNSGTYDVHGGVHYIDTSRGWDEWMFITGTGSPRTLSEGTNSIALNFNAGDIYNMLQQKSYNGKLTIWTGVQNMTTWDHIAHAEYTTSSDYSTNSFSPPGLTIECTSDYNNATDYLTVNVTINASSAYQNTTLDVHGGLHYKQGWEWRFITGFGTQINLTNQTTTIPINFNGGAIRSSEQSGPYDVWVGISQEGQWDDIAHDDNTTNSYNYADFAAPPVRIISNTDYANGTNYLTINVTLNASQTGTYFLEGGLHWIDGYQWRWITWEGTDINITSTGEQTFPLNFDGKQIANAQNDGWNGGTLVAWICVINTTTWNEINRLDEYTTGSYSPNDFSASPVTFNGSIQDSRVNTTLGGGAPYDQLRVVVPITLNSSGNYEIFAGLFDVGNNTLITTASKTFTSGINVTLNFTGTKIYRKHFNGTFEFRAKIFDTDSWFECDNMINTTGYHNYTDFELAIPEATIAGSYSNYTNQNGDVVINVSVNVTQDEIKYELYGDLFNDSGAIYITNAKNITYFGNQTGTVTAQLVFNGSTITNSSGEAPYKLAYLRLSIYNTGEAIWEELDQKNNPYENINP